MGGWICLCLLLLSIAACRTGKKATRQKTEPAIVQEAVSQSSTDNILPTSLSDYPTIAFSSFSGKVKCNYSHKNTHHDFIANIRIEKDKALWVSIQALGGIIQVGRVLITPDSFKMINNLQQEVILKSLADAVKILPVPADFYMLQNLIIGNVLKPQANIVGSREEDLLWILVSKEGGLLQEGYYQKSDSTLQLFSMRDETQHGPSGTIRLGQYELRSQRSFSMYRHIQVQHVGEEYALEMQFQNASFDEPVSMPFSIPKGYKQTQ